MKSKIAVLLLAVLLCLTTGCNNASHIAETPDPISSPANQKRLRQKRKRRLTAPKAQNHKQTTVPQSSRQAVRKVTPKQQRFPIRLTTARQCCHSRANLKRKQTSPNADRKPLPRQKKNSPHLRQRKNKNRQIKHNPQSHPSRNPQSRHLTLATGSVLLRAMPRVSVLR